MLVLIQVANTVLRPKKHLEITHYYKHVKAHPRNKSKN